MGGVRSWMEKGSGREHMGGRNELFASFHEKIALLRIKHTAGFARRPELSARLTRQHPRGLVPGRSRWLRRLGTLLGGYLVLRRRRTILVLRHCRPEHVLACRPGRRRDDSRIG